MIVKKTIIFVLALLTFASFTDAQNYAVSETKKFTPQNKNVLLLQDSGSVERKIILFQTTLRVNTDGSPNSYHPLDPRGATKALNNVCNAIAVRRIGSEDNLCKTEFNKAIEIFEQWRDKNWTVPDGYSNTFAKKIFENLRLKVK